MGYTPPYLDVRLVSGIWCIRPPGISGVYARYFPNNVDNFPQLLLAGGEGFNIIVPATKKVIIEDHVVGEFVNIGYATPDVSINPLINKNIFLNPTGTGYVKFGTKTGTGDVAVDGHLDIKDALGNVVKLATVA